jgi:hypothetical protein
MVSGVLCSAFGEFWEPRDTSLHFSYLFVACTIWLSNNADWWPKNLTVICLLRPASAPKHPSEISMLRDAEMHFIVFKQEGRRSYLRLLPRQLTSRI